MKCNELPQRSLLVLPSFNQISSGVPRINCNFQRLCFGEVGFNDGS